MDDYSGYSSGATVALSPPPPPPPPPPPSGSYPASYSGYSSGASYSNHTTPTSVPGYAGTSSSFGSGVPASGSSAAGFGGPQPGLSSGVVPSSGGGNQSSPGMTASTAPAPRYDPLSSGVPILATKYVSPVTGSFMENASNLFKASRSGGLRRHSGADWRAENGSKAVAVIGGKVVYRGFDGNRGGYGHYVNVLGDDGTMYRYAPHQAVSVDVGDRVEQGDEIGTIGVRHLHLEVIDESSPVYEDMKAGKPVGTSMPTWYRGPDKALDQEKFFGLPRGLNVTGGKQFNADAGISVKSIWHTGNPFAKAPSEDVKALQTQLAKDGFYKGKIDGISGPLTLQAIADKASFAPPADIPAKAVAGVPLPRLRPGGPVATGFVGMGPMAFPQAAGVVPIPHLRPPLGSIADLVIDNEGRLEKGSFNAAATEWQLFLNAGGFTDKDGLSLTIDGKFGRRTVEATKAYQDSRSITVDGKVGPETLNAALADFYPDKVILPGTAAYSEGAIAAEAIIGGADPMRDRGTRFDRRLERINALTASSNVARIKAREMREQSGEQQSDARPMGKVTIQQDGAMGAEDRPVKLADLRSPEGDLIPPPMGWEYFIGDTDDYVLRSRMKELGIEPGSKLSLPDLDKLLGDVERQDFSDPAFKYPASYYDRDHGGVRMRRSPSAPPGFWDNLGDQHNVQVVSNDPNYTPLTIRRILESAAAANAQRLDDKSSIVVDRFRPQAVIADAVPLVIRTAEAIREFSRGVSDSYRRVMDAQRFESFKDTDRVGALTPEEARRSLFFRSQIMTNALEGTLDVHAFRARPAQ